MWNLHKYCSSNINEDIKTVLNFFFYEKISHVQKALKAPKAPKSTKMHQDTRAKAQISE